MTNRGIKMKISTCSNYDNTQLKEYNNNKVSHNWEIQEVAWEKEAIVTLTTEYGISCNEYTDGHRRNDSWIATHAIMLDFDDGRLSTESLLKKQ